MYRKRKCITFFGEYFKGFLNFLRHKHFDFSMINKFVLIDNRACSHVIFTSYH